MITPIAGIMLDILSILVLRWCNQWAWAWTGWVFTAGVYMTGIVEVQNNLMKAWFGPQKLLKQVYDVLNAHTDGQLI